MQLYVIRHGETEMGRNKIIATVDQPLNSNGIQQAINVEKQLRALNIDVIYCSLIERAKHTLQLFNFNNNIPVIIEDRIKERDMGSYEKIPFESLDWDMFWNYNSNLKYPELESMKSVYDRISNFINEIKLKYENNNVLLVTHGGISRAICWYFNGIPDNGNSSSVNENCKIYKYTV